MTLANNMKIAVLHSGDLSSISLGGIDRYVKNLIMFSEPNEITVLGVTKKGEYEVGKIYERAYCNIPYYFIPIIDDHKYPLSPRYTLRLLRYLRVLKKFDCVYAQRTEYALPFMFSKTKNKLFEIIHGSSKYSEVFWGKNKARIHRFIEKQAIKIAKKTYVILNRQEFGVPYYKKKYHRYSNKIFYGKNPIDITVFKPFDKVMARKELKITASKVICYIGRVEQNPKRVLIYPEIMKNICSIFDDCLFIVIGDGADKEKMISIVSDYSLSKKFMFLGYIEDANLIAKYINASDLTINISIFEGTCTSNLESVACGTPVVSTDVGDIREILTDERNGVIIHEDEKTIVKEATEAIIKLLKSKVEMSDEYLKYSGEQIMKELKEDICNTN